MYLFIFFKYFTIYELKQLFLFIIFNLKHSKTLKKKKQQTNAPAHSYFYYISFKF